MDLDTLRRCKYCGEDKLASEYLPKRHRCKECRRIENYRLFSLRKEEINKKKRELRREWKLRAIEKMGNKCAHCGGVFPPCVYDFHHLDPKEKEISPAAAPSWEVLEKELSKCIMLCANCHRVEHNGNVE